MPDPIILPNGDIVVDATVTYKARTEYIHIDNSTPGALAVQVVQSLRGMNADGVLSAAPAVRKVRTFTPAELVNVEINGLTFPQVYAWIHTWAASVNHADASAMVADLLPPPVAPPEPPPVEDPPAEDPPEDPPVEDPPVDP